MIVLAIRANPSVLYPRSALSKLFSQKVFCLEKSVYICTHKTPQYERIKKHDRNAYTGSKGRPKRILGRFNRNSNHLRRTMGWLMVNRNL